MRRLALSLLLVAAISVAAVLLDAASGGWRTVTWVVPVGILVTGSALVTLRYLRRE